MDTELAYFTTNFFIAVVGYLLFPFIWCVSKKQFPLKKLKRRIILNGLLVYFIFVFLGGGNASAAFLWSYVAYWMVKQNCLVEEPIESTENPIAATDTAPTTQIEESIISTSVSSCRKCGKELSTGSRYCRYCGKKVKQAKTFLSWKKRIAVLLILLMLSTAGAFTWYFITSYQGAMTAISNQEFVLAKWHFDKIPYSEKLFPQETSYTKAGILMEQGDYLDALEAFEKLAFPVPSSVTEELTQKLYSKAIDDYRNKSYPNARVAFNAIENYKRSKDYLILIKCQSAPYLCYYDELVNWIGFEDAKKILTDHEVFFEEFISGEWRTQNNSNYFKIDNKGYSTYNLPITYVSGGYYKITDGIYYEGKEGNENQKQFKFTIVDKNTISVFCYKNNKNYKLIRKQ